MAKINIGVIGLGRMGQLYSNHIARSVDTAQVTAVCDSRSEVAEQIAGQFPGTKAYTDYRELLEDPAIQAVIVVTPTSTHAEVVMAAAAAGKAIFCEKPTALTLGETEEMALAVDRAGVLLQIGFMRRFDKGFQAAKRKIEEGAIGDPATIRTIGRDPHRTSLEFAAPAHSGGILIDMGIHDVDTCRWLMADEFEQVFAQAGVLVYPELAEVGDVDNAMVLANFTQGGLGYIEVSRTAYYGHDVQCEILGTRGALRIGHLLDTPLWVLTSNQVCHDVIPHFMGRFQAAYTAQIEEFVASVVQDRQPVVGIADARIALQVCIAATLSQHEGRSVRIEEILGQRA
jgi:scyllo-inositol 2-dehydrogenase (NAD+)